MKYVSLVITLIGLSSLVGCANLNPSPNLTDQQFQDLVKSDSAEVKQIAITATDVALASLTDVKARTDAATLANKVATAVNTATASPTFDFSGIDALIAAQLGSSNIPQKPLVAALVNGISLVVQDNLNTNATLSADRRLVLAKALLASVSEGVMSETTSVKINGVRTASLKNVK